jgi:hypothetical protein
LVLKQGRISLGDDEFFEIAAKDTKYFLLTETTGEEPKQTPFEKYLILDYFSPTRAHE